MMVVVFGHDKWRDYEKIFQRLDKLPADTTVVHSGQTGVATRAGHAAAMQGKDVLVIPERWDVHGAAAVPMQIQEMIDLKPDLLLAFHPYIKKSKATADAVRRAELSGIEVEVIE